MTTFSGFDANQAIVNFFGMHSSALPEEHRQFMLEAIAGRDLLRTIIITTETLYAARGSENFPEEGVALMGQLGLFIEANDFYGMAERARSIVAVSERIRGEGDAVLETDEPQSELYAPKAVEVETIEPEG